MEVLAPFDTVINRTNIITYHLSAAANLMAKSGGGEL
jgi:hypothetical protein